MRAVVLLSGGLDSYTAAAIAKSEGFSLYALTVDYGQRHAREIASARQVAKALDVARHLELAVDLRAIGRCPPVSSNTVRPPANSRSISGYTSSCSSGSPPVISTSGQS